MIGAQTENTENLWFLLIAISIHMSLIAFSVTLRLLMEQRNYLRILLSMCLWSLMGPIGMLTTSVMTSRLGFVNGVFQCLSAGTFIHVTFLDMLSSDLSNRKIFPLGNLILITTGFFIVVFASQWHQHSH